MSGTELQILIYEPLATGGGFLDDNLSFTADNLQEKTTAFGGYWTLTFPIAGRQSDIEEWITNGLGRHIEAYSSGLDRVWEGFVSQIDASIGGMSLSVGPLLDTVANRVYVAYAPEDLTTGAVGTTTFSTVGNNTDSQAKYGIIERVIAGSNNTEAVALQVQAMALEENAEPLATEADNLASSSIASARVTCLGYAHWLKAYTYQDTTIGSQNADTKLTAVLGGDPNSILSTDYTHITANVVSLQQQETARRTAWNIIQSITAVGDSGNDRMMFGLYNDRTAWYQLLPTTPIYERRLSAPTQALQRFRSGSTVEPTSALAGEWAFYTDLLIGRLPGDSLRQDPRYLFIEEKSYSVPWALTLQGAKVARLDQMLARLGLQGSSA